MTDAQAKEMYNDVRKGMGVNESVDEDFETLLIEGVHDKSIFKAVFLAGGPGSGKDYVLDNTLSGHGLTEINSDKALEFLMDKEGLDKTMPSSEQEKRDLVRGRAKSMTELRQRLALLGRNGLIINGTGDDHEKISRIKDRLEEIGYDTSMVMVNTDDEISKQRNIERGTRGGRTVPEEIRKQKWDAVQASRPELAKMFGDKYMEFDNSEDLRQASPEVVKAKKDEMLQLFKNVQQFVTEPPQSEAASLWVAHEMDVNDKLPIPKDGAEMTPHPDSGAAQEARSMGLQYYGFGRYGKNGKVTHRSIHDKLVEVQKGEPEQPNIPVPGTSMKKKTVNEEFEEVFSEDLRNWFSKSHPEGDWKRINSKGEAIGPCAREPGEPKPKCMSRAKRESLSKKERASAVRAKRKHDPNPERKGEPINVSNYGKGKLSESYSLSDSSAMNLLLLGTRIDEVDFDTFEEQKEIKLLKDTNGKIRTYMLRRAAAKEAHTMNGTVIPYKNGYVIKLNEENKNVQSTNQLSENQTKTGISVSSFRRFNQSGTRESGKLISEGVTELTTGSEYAKGGIEATPTTTQETGSSKITLAKIRSKQKEVRKESIDKGIEPGLSMASSGENSTRGGITRIKPIKKPLEELTGDETTMSIGAKKEDELKKVGINLQSFKAKKFVG
jgi:dephospho-CoA kinase